LKIHYNVFASTKQNYSTTDFQPRPVEKFHYSVPVSTKQNYNWFSTTIYWKFITLFLHKLNRTKTDFQQRPVEKFHYNVSASTKQNYNWFSTTTCWKFITMSLHQLTQNYNWFSITIYWKFITLSLHQLNITTVQLIFNYDQLKNFITVSESSISVCQLKTWFSSMSSQHAVYRTMFSGIISIHWPRYRIVMHSSHAIFIIFTRTLFRKKAPVNNTRINYKWSIYVVQCW
jgi:hypothetical protein